jgi:hypothetical protein
VSLKFSFWRNREYDIVLYMKKIKKKSDILVHVTSGTALHTVDHIAIWTTWKRGAEGCCPTSTVCVIDSHTNQPLQKISYLHKAEQTSIWKPIRWSSKIRALETNRSTESIFLCSGLSASVSRDLWSLWSQGCLDYKHRRNDWDETSNTCTDIERRGRIECKSFHSTTW